MNLLTGLSASGVGEICTFTMNRGCGCVQKKENKKPERIRRERGQGA